MRVDLLHRLAIPLRDRCRGECLDRKLRIRAVLAETDEFRCPHVENDTVRDIYLAAKDAELVEVKCRRSVDVDERVTVLPEGDIRIPNLYAERGECQILHVQHSVPADMNSVWVHEYEIAAARLIHCAEDVGELCARDLIDEGLVIGNVEIQRLAAEDVERLPVDLTVVIRRDGRVVIDNGEIRSAVDCNVANTAYDLATRRHGECGARKCEGNECRETAATHFLLEIHSVPSFPILRSSRLPSGSNGGCSAC